MRTKHIELTPHGKKVLDALTRSGKPMSAYDLLGKLGVKTPPTVYRALESLMKHGLVHKIESLNAFVACHGHDDEHAAQFAVCRACGTVTEIEDKKLSNLIHSVGKKLQFHIEREMLELLGLCRKCESKSTRKAA